MLVIFMSVIQCMLSFLTFWLFSLNKTFFFSVINDSFDAQSQGWLLWKLLFRTQHDNLKSKEIQLNETTNRNSHNLISLYSSHLNDLNGLLITELLSIFRSINYKLVDGKWITLFELAIKQTHQTLTSSSFLIQRVLYILEISTINKQLRQNLYKC